MTLIRRSLAHTIVQLNQKVIAHQMIQDPLTVSHQQHEKKMFDGEHNTQRANSIFLTLYHHLHGSHTVFISTIGCRSFQTGVTVFQVYLFTRISAHVSRLPHGPLFESDTRVIERARLRVYSTRVSGNSTRLHADLTTVVIISVTVDLVSVFLLRCPGKSDFRSRQVTSTQCTQLTLRDWTSRIMVKKYGIDLTTFSHSDSQKITLAATMKLYATASRARQDRLGGLHLNAVARVATKAVNSTI